MQSIQIVLIPGKYSQMADSTLDTVAYKEDNKSLRSNVEIVQGDKQIAVASYFYITSTIIHKLLPCNSTQKELLFEHFKAWNAITRDEHSWISL